MNTAFYALAAITVLGTPSRAIDWEAVKRAPAQIKVINMQPARLAEEKKKVEKSDKVGWVKVPPQLKTGAVIYEPSRSTNGVADVTVLGDGYLMLACNYDNQGNGSGKWDEEAWNEEKFKAEGWQVVAEADLGGLLVKNDNRSQTIFLKQVKKGEAFRLRCNKYDPPFPILLKR